METHQPCPACGSHDALTIYEDGHSYCFSCNTYFGSDKEEKKLSSGLKKQGLIDLQDMVVSPLPKRKLTNKLAPNMATLPLRCMVSLCRLLVTMMMTTNS